MTYELVSLVSDEPRKEYWWGGRNGGISEWGDWLASDSWSAYRVLRRPEPGLKSLKPPPEVKLHVNVSGKRGKNGRARPFRWYAHVSFGGVNRPGFGGPIGGKCKSVKEALRKALAHPELDAEIDKVLRKAYRPDGAECVYHMVDGEWVPWMTFLNIDHQEGCWDWPNGEYQIRSWRFVHQEKQWQSQAWVRRRSPWCLSGSGRQESLPDLENWLPKPQ